MGTKYQGTNDERKFIELQIINKAIIAELRTLRDEHAKDLSYQRRPLPAPDFLSKFIVKTIKLRTPRDERAKDLSIQRRPLTALDYISKLIAKAISDCAKNRLLSTTTRILTFRRVRRRFERQNDAIKKLLRAHDMEVMDIENSCREFEQNTEGLFGPTKWSRSMEAEWTGCDSFLSRKRIPHPPLNESNKSCD
ncbi:hypothetical protein JTB14_021970 [Gonioctena quinquepunctata]|nr:hypothetical protein JTB14_021970 [Gonioctena quinquepunctata]